MEAELAVGAERPTHRSVSQLLSYSACGEAYRLERRTEAPRRPAGWFVQGHAFHTAVEAWENSGRTMPRSELHELYLSTYRTEANELLERHELDIFMTAGGKRPENDLSDREELGWWQVQNYQEYALTASRDWTVHASEVEFRFHLGGIEQYGFIDQVRKCKYTGLLYPADLKTGTTLPAAPVQLALYRLAMVHLYGAEAVADYGTWVQAGRPNARSPKGQFTRDLRQELANWPAERLIRWVQDMDRAERLGIYLPNPSDSCRRSCGVAQWCRAIGWHYPSIEQYAGVLLPSTEDTHAEG